MQLSGLSASEVVVSHEARISMLEPTLVPFTTVLSFMTNSSMYKWMNGNIAFSLAAGQFVIDSTIKVVLVSDGYSTVSFGAGISVSSASGAFLIGGTLGIAGQANTLLFWRDATGLVQVSISQNADGILVPWNPMDNPLQLSVPSNAGAFIESVSRGFYSYLTALGNGYGESSVSAMSLAPNTDGRVEGTFTGQQGDANKAVVIGLKRAADPKFQSTWPYVIEASALIKSFNFGSQAGLGPAPTNVINRLAIERKKNQVIMQYSQDNRLSWVTLSTQTVDPSERLYCGGSGYGNGSILGNIAHVGFA